jgi:hypothetical protein
MYGSLDAGVIRRGFTSLDLSNVRADNQSVFDVDRGLIEDEYGEILVAGGVGPNQTHTQPRILRQDDSKARDVLFEELAPSVSRRLSADAIDAIATAKPVAARFPAVRDSGSPNLGDRPPCNSDLEWHADTITHLFGQIDDFGRDDWLEREHDCQADNNEIISFDDLEFLTPCNNLDDGL